MGPCMIGTMTQVAFQLPDDDLAAIDALIPSEYPSRAAVLRAAVAEWLRQIEERRIDAALAAGYRLLPPGEEEDEWAGISVEAVNRAALEW
jgi:Arc/MetJ-type ribon-helix-helix transcriptional regulator